MYYNVTNMKLLDLQPEAFGIDISTRSLKVAQLKQRGLSSSNLKLVGHGEGSVKEGVIEKSLVQDQQSLVESIQRTLARAQGINTNYTIASLPEEKSFLQIIQMPKMEQEEIQQAVKYQAESYIPFSMEEVYFDSEVISPIQNSLDHTDVLIVALPKKIVDPYVSCLKKAGLVPLALEVESQAIARALIKDFISVRPLLLIDLGATRTTIMLYSGRALRFTAYIPVSSRQFTRIISERLEVSFEQAERKKIKHGLKGGGSEKVSQALEPILNDLVEQIENHLEHYRTHSFHEHLPTGNNEIEEILLTGGGSNLKGLPEFLTSRLGIKTELGNPWVNILSEDLKQVPQLSFKESLRYSVALGLALRPIIKHD